MLTRQDNIMINQGQFVFTSIFLCISQLRNFLNNLKPIYFFVMGFFGYNKYYIRSVEIRNIILQKLNKYKFYCSSYNENKEISGTCIHYSICPKFIYEVDEGYYIFCTPKFFDDITTNDYVNKVIELDENFIPENDDEDDNDTNDEDDETQLINVKTNNNKIKYVAKSGEYGYLQYRIRNINLTNISRVSELNFMANQENLFKQIMGFYRNNNYCKVYLSGEPGCGKTFFSYLMAQKLDCYLCDVFNPYEPSCSFTDIYTMTKVYATKPIIVLLDEVDVLISKIHNNGNEEHKKFSREIFNKTTWCNFMDKIEFGLFPYVILIMNSNKPKEYIDRMDKSYLRNGRVNIIEKW